MIRRVSANKKEFHAVTFQPGFNLILAERTEAATDRDSRNGLGKSTLLEIIHFCLGSKGTKDRGVVVDALKDWVFRVDLTAGEHDLSFSRAVADPKWIEVDSKYDDWPIQPTIENNRACLSIADQRILLGRMLFSLTADIENVKFGPTYRSLVSYLMRLGPDGFLDPFTHFRMQHTWDKQVNTAYHLGLTWRDATAFQELRVEKGVIDDLTRAAKTGTLPSYLGSEGELEAERVRLATEIHRKGERLAAFKVRDDYREIEQASSSLAEQIHELVNDNISARRKIELYAERLGEERNSVITASEVEKLYQEAGVVLPGQVQRRLSDLKLFHDAVIKNRGAYLTDEIEQLSIAITMRDRQIDDLERRKGDYMRVLESSGALEEYTRLQDLLVESQGRLHDVEARLARLREITRSRSEWEEHKTRVQKAARTHYDELQAERDRAIQYFHANTEALYETPGRLIIDIDDTGFEFDVKIDRSESHGVSNMKIFCFDLMLMQLWSHRNDGPGFLIHDSTLFDGVDERQIAAALELARSESERLGFQYVCSLNSDDLPREELGDGHAVLDAVVLHLRDDDPSGMLLGIEF
jgi:uncharacterized protein YydD (DUF2326 family)